MNADLLLGIAVLLLFISVFLPPREGYMDSDVMSIQNDLTLQKVLVDKQLNAMNLIVEKEPDDTVDIGPILKKMVTKLQTLVKEGKPENAQLIQQLKDLRQKTEQLPPIIETYRNEVKKFSGTKLNEAMTVKDFLPATQSFIEGLKKDAKKILEE